VLIEWRPRSRRGQVDWYQDRYDLGAPSFSVLDKDGHDVTADFVPGAPFEGDAYPFRGRASRRYPQGRPLLPLSLRHAARAPRHLFSPWRRIETVDGTLDAGAVNGMTRHVAFQASFPTTFLMGGSLQSGVSDVEDEKGQPIARHRVLDPAVIHEVAASEPGVTPSVQVVRNETDLLMLQDYAERIGASLGPSWGLSPADLQRTAADARSGVALAISGEARRRMQASLAPTYRPHDERLIGVAAAMLTRAGVVDLPDTGWRVTYRLSPLSPSERSQRQAEGEALYRLGAITLAELRAHVTGEPIAVARAAVEALAAPPAPAASPAPPRS
jgi:hypothetical protein